MVVEGCGDCDQVENCDEYHHEHGIDDNNLSLVELGLPMCNFLNSLKMKNVSSFCWANRTVYFPKLNFIADMRQMKVASWKKDCFGGVEEN